MSMYKYFSKLEKMNEILKKEMTGVFGEMAGELYEFYLDVKKKKFSSRGEDVTATFIEHTSTEFEQVGLMYFRTHLTEDGSKEERYLLHVKESKVINEMTLVTMYWRALKDDIDLYEITEHDVVHKMSKEKVHSALSTLIKYNNTDNTFEFLSLQSMCEAEYFYSFRQFLYLFDISLIDSKNH